MSDKNSKLETTQHLRTFTEQKFDKIEEDVETEKDKNEYERGVLEKKNLETIEEIEQLR